MDEEDEDVERVEKALREPPKYYYHKVNNTTWQLVNQDEVYQFDSKSVMVATGDRDLTRQLNILVDPTGSECPWYVAWSGTIRGHTPEDVSNTTHCHSVKDAIKSCIAKQHRTEVYGSACFARDGDGQYASVNDVPNEIITGIETPDGIVFVWRTTRYYGNECLRFYPTLKLAKKYCRPKRVVELGQPEYESQLQKVNRDLKEALFAAVYKLPGAKQLVSEWIGGGKSYDSNFQHYINQIDFLLAMKRKTWLIDHAGPQIKKMVDVLSTCKRKPGGKNWQAFRAKAQDLLNLKTKGKTNAHPVPGRSGGEIPVPPVNAPATA